MRVVPALLSCAALLELSSLSAHAATAQIAPPLTLLVDAREISRNVVHVRLDVPVSGGATILNFPKWVPGEHAPANPVVDLAMLQASANGAIVPWVRDPVDLFRFTFSAPAGATDLTLRYDFLLAPGHATSRLALMDWNSTLLYPAGARIGEQTVMPSVLLPAGWAVATALDGPVRSPGRIDFGLVTIERLFDSPLLAGANLTTVALAPAAELDVASDSPSPVVIESAVRTHFGKLVAEAQALFGAHHWRAPYRFLVSATDAIGYTGLEHHESSWNGVDTSTLATSAATKRFAGDLLCHEFVHSWNGKYRRPAGLVRADYQSDETTDLLWVYEGLTEYYSDVLAVRAGFWTPAEYRAALAAKYAYLDTETGRATRSLADTTFQARLSAGRAAFPGARRSGEEYYDEGELMWLDADTLIRERSHGRRSLDDFAAAFFGGTDGPPAVVSYTRADVVAALNTVAPNDWEGFLAARLDRPTMHPPLGGIVRGGYRLNFEAKPAVSNPSMRIGGSENDLRYSLGARVSESGAVTDVIGGSPAALGGLVPGMTLVAVDDRRYSQSELTAAIAGAATTRRPIALLVNDRQTFETKSIEYTGGARFPILARSPGSEPIIDAITQPRLAVRRAGK